MDSLTRQAVEESREVRRQRHRGDFWFGVSVTLAGIVVLLLLAIFAPKGKAAELAISPADAVYIARDDARELGFEALETVYLFNLYGDDAEELGAFSYSLNTVISTNTTPQLLCSAVDEAGHVLRVNMRTCCPRDADYTRVRLLWETLAHRNFYFHSINPFFKANADGIALASVDDKHIVVREVPPFVLKGKTFRAKHFAHFVPGVFLAGLKGKDLSAYDELCELTGSENPIMRMDQFICISHRAARDGLYYDLAGIPATEAEFDRLVGADFQRSADLRADRRSVVWRREMNGSPSMFEWANTVGYDFPAVKTLDFARRESGADKHPLYNILDRNHVATEEFAAKSNGHILMALFNAKGERQDVAPGNVAIDYSVHPPVEVEAGLCFRCHNQWLLPAGNSLLAMVDANVKVKGWKELPLRQKFRKLGIIDDFGQKDDIEDILDRAAGLYGGNPQEPFALANFAHAKAAIASTGGIFGNDPVPKVTAKLTEQFNRYEQDSITPLMACLELGIRAKDDIEAQRILSDVSLSLHPNTYGFSPETPALWALVTWKPKSRDLPKRQDWETEYATLMARVNNALRAGELKL